MLEPPFKKSFPSLARQSLPLANSLRMSKLLSLETGVSPQLRENFLTCRREA